MKRKLVSFDRSLDLALLNAVLTNNEQQVLDLLLSRACPNTEDMNGFSVLYIACENNFNTIVRFLIAAGAVIQNAELKKLKQSPAKNELLFYSGLFHSAKFPGDRSDPKYEDYRATLMIGVAKQLNYGTNQIAGTTPLFVKAWVLYPEIFKIAVAVNNTIKYSTDSEFQYDYTKLETYKDLGISLPLEIVDSIINTRANISSDIVFLKKLYDLLEEENLAISYIPRQLVSNPSLAQNQLHHQQI